MLFMLCSHTGGLCQWICTMHIFMFPLVWRHTFEGLSSQSKHSNSKFYPSASLCLGVLMIYAAGPVASNGQRHQDIDWLLCTHTKLQAVWDIHPPRTYYCAHSHCEFRKAVPNTGQKIHLIH